MSAWADVLVGATSTITAVGVTASARYLRRIATNQFRDELHLLDHEQRLEALEARRAS